MQVSSTTNSSYPGSTSSATGSLASANKVLEKQRNELQADIQEAYLSDEMAGAMRSSNCNKKCSKLRQIQQLQMDETKEAIKVKRLRKRVGIAWKSVTKLTSSMLKRGRNSSNPQVFLKPFWLC
ncbi:hypothetical protein [Peribacillus butanolivorans]|uniref:hypothetical protein n=1 Tax=Peribacillus butanolivorans TaxID=421767 RepID=UPI0036556402